MSEIRFQRWLAGVGLVGGVVITLALPYIVLAYGGDLPGGMKLALVILALLGGIAVAIVSVVLGIAVPTVVSDAGKDLVEACCPPEQGNEKKGTAVT